MNQNAERKCQLNCKLRASELNLIQKIDFGAKSQRLRDLVTARYNYVSKKCDRLKIKLKFGCKMKILTFSPRASLSSSTFLASSSIGSLYTLVPATSKYEVTEITNRIRIEF